jgi:hypothetical protein
LSSGRKPSFTFINAPGLVTVSPDSMRGWVLYDEQAGTVCSDTNLCNLVDGPAGAPGGTGSAELAVLSTAGGKALIIPDYGGLRLDQVTTLSYSTYRQTVDDGNNLAIALQLNVDYDLSDASTGYQGRLVYEPYQTSGGQVLQSTWQTWDAMAGKWWGTRASVVRNGQTVANPCVQSSPCTWTQVLTYFPNIGVHATMGAIVLKAGSGWANFRGNVDSFVIGINGSTTTFDFELRAGAPPHLRTAIGAEVVSARVWSADSVYAPGTVVNYDFAARPGRATPIVVLDDTLAAPSGQFVMNGDHALIAESDTIYSYATLQPLEKSLADLQKNMLTSSDKVAANQAMIDFMLGQEMNGVDPDALDHAAAVAERVTFDPVRDSAAMSQLGAALDNWSFYVDLYSDGTIATYQEFGAPGVTPLTSTAPLPGVLRTPSDFRPAASRSARRIGPKGLSLAPFRGMVPSKPSQEALADPESPWEFTYILVTNGINNSMHQANQFLARVVQIARKQDRFQKDYTTIILRYNKNHETEMAEWDKDHPCIKPSDDLGWQTMWLLSHVAEYAKCKLIRQKVSLMALDLAESSRLRLAKLNSLAVDHPETLELADKILELRDRFKSHVILVEHSEGTLIGANALAIVAEHDGRPLEKSDRCVAMLALAPALPRSSFPLDQYHLTGLLAEHDVLRLTGISNPADWESITTPLGDSVAKMMALLGPNPGPASVGNGPLIELMASPDVHAVAQYLSEGTNSRRFGDRLVNLHRECIAGSGTLSLAPSTAPLGSTVKLSATILNQNGRPLIGRKMKPSDPSPMLQNVDSVTYLAYAPREWAGQMSLRVSDNLTLTATVSVPLLSVPTTLAKRDSLWWTVVGGSNGGLGSPAPGPIPTSGSCGEVRRVPGEGQSYVDYLGNCATLYHVDYSVPSTLSSGLPIRGGQVTWKRLDGTLDGSDDTICGGSQPCLESVKVEWIDTFGGVVARTITPIQ